MAAIKRAMELRKKEFLQFNPYNDHTKDTQWKSLNDAYSTIAAVKLNEALAIDVSLDMIISIEKFVAFKKELVKSKIGLGVNVLKGFESKLLSSAIMKVKFKCSNAVYQIFCRHVD